MLLLTTLLARRIVRPLAKLQEAAEDISNLSFKQVQIQTGDEIELLAHSINRMSTKLEQSHLALEEKNRNLRTFIADISHELKTPLSLIKAYAAGIKDGLDDGTYVDVIERQADEITNLVDKLLELSRLQTDTYTMSAWDFQSLFHTTLEKYRIALQQQSIVVEVNEVGLVNTYVWADRQKIEIVLNNLIMNAIKYTTDHRIQITLEHVDRSLLVTITNGMEVREDMNWDNLWEPFYVLESSRNKQLSGTGLGLSIVRAIMIKHDSRSTVHVHNREITFQISITLYGDSL
jgi:signal transduction histidine kinase